METNGTAYEKPALVALGTLADLTEGLTSGTDNAAVGTMAS